ncbi:hypothetical protein BCR44DRAFT_82542, partial [Catenaria anguillulae PL171]
MHPVFSSAQSRGQNFGPCGRPPHRWPTTATTPSSQQARQCQQGATLGKQAVEAIKRGGLSVSSATDAVPASP